MARIASQTIIDLIDQSYIPDDTVAASDKPLFLVAMSADKGPEGLTETDATDYFKLYGQPSYKKHGQVSIQTPRIINAGGRCLVKRVVAEDATLANIIIVCEVTKLGEMVPIPDGDGAMEYKEPEVGPKVKIKYSIATIEGAKDKNDVYNGVAALYKKEDLKTTYPIIGIVDLGRCDSQKKLRIVPDYRTSKDLGFMQYNLYVMEGTKTLETISFSLDQTMIYSNISYGIPSSCEKSKQVRADMYPQFDEFKEELMNALGIIEGDDTTFYLNDILFGCDKLGKKLQEIEVDEESVNLSTAMGIKLQSGSNGSFGDCPIQSEDYVKALTDVFDGTATDDIYDITRYQIFAVVDANYPAPVKRAIEQLMTYRMDGFFFSDLGFVKTLEQIKAVHNQALLNKYSASYHLSYEVLDPYSLKNVPVTCMYSIAPLLVSLYDKGVVRPFNGMIYDVVIRDAIKGTVNFIPKKTPTVDQKQELVDTQVNYACYYKDDLVIESQYTRQPEHTQCSYINNMLSIQEVIRDLRMHCPTTRYSFLDGNDFDSYKKDCEERLKLFKDNFESLEFEYLADPTAIQNKQFTAAIKVDCRDYVHAEHFKIYVIG